MDQYSTAEGEEVRGQQARTEDGVRQGQAGLGNEHQTLPLRGPSALFHISKLQGLVSFVCDGTLDSGSDWDLERVLEAQVSPHAFRCRGAVMACVRS